MKAITPRLKAYLDSRPTKLIIADCFTLTLANGNIYRWTNADVPVTVYRGEDDDSGTLGLGVLGDFTLADATGLTPDVFAANSVRIQGLKATQKVGLDVDEQDVTILCQTTPAFLQSADSASSGALGAGELGSMTLAAGPSGGNAFGPSLEMIEGIPFLWACQQGILDYATLQRETAFLPAWGSPAIGAVVRFFGDVAAIDKIGYAEVQAKVRSQVARLDTPYPRNIYQPTCIHVLFDTGCAIRKSDFQISGAVGASSTDTVIEWSSGKAAGYFDQGTIDFTSGDLSGFSATIKSSDTSSLTVIDPLPVAPQPGDTFKAAPGCDHTDGAQGCAKFNNKRHFRGYPRVPPPITAA